ncbi:MAG: chromate transporter [Clostridia bacterium]|nr:chromate transporter [Clostridia bacterium]
MTLIKLFFEFLKIGAFSFGGGMATLPYVYEMAERTGWIEETGITNILAVSQVTPGPLACNIGTIVGMNAQGIWGAIIANIAFVIPAICFMGISYRLIKKIENNGIASEVIKVVRAAALAMLVTSSITLFKSAFFTDNYSINFKCILLGLGIYVGTKYNKLSTIQLMLISSIIGGIIMV